MPTAKARLKPLVGVVIELLNAFVLVVILSSLFQLSNPNLV